jgi:menaquinone-dependent protoporphyrinogen oxidase
MKILVTYATRHGATRGIAERIAQTLGEFGHAVRLRPIAEAGDPIEYDAVVIGSAAYMGGWLGAATRYVRRHSTELAARPVWLFSSGPIGPDKVDKNGRDVLEASRPREFVEFDQIVHPRDTAVFFGVWDPDAPPIGLAERVMAHTPARRALPAGDFREWPKIEDWARNIGQALKAEPASVAG